MKKKKKGNGDLEYAHNPRYSMIVPDAGERDDDSVASTGQS